MLVVKSLLSGSLTISPSKKRLARARTDETQTASQDDVTTIDETSNGSSVSAGSTQYGDSFVLAIDWEHTTSSALDESFPDPYLESKEALQKRLCKADSNDNAELAKTPERPPQSPSIDFETSPGVKSLGSFAVPIATPGKSLGTFALDAWPEDGADDEYSADAGPTISMPRKLQFSTPTNVNPTSTDDSFTIPDTPTLTKVTPSRKRRHRARLRVRELKEQLNDGSKKRSKLQTAKLYLLLGKAEQRAYFFPAAINSFFQAAALYRTCQKHTALATALDLAAFCYGQAYQAGMSEAVHNQHKVSVFFRCVNEAIQIRKRELGSSHVDTVNSLQHLAQLCLLTGHPKRAAAHYLEVLQFRKAILGKNHPSTAVTAHCLGNAYLQCHDTVAAEIWYDHAMDTYNAMNLPDNNPAVSKLLRDRKRLERVELWMEQDPKDDEALLFEL